MNMRQFNASYCTVRQFSAEFVGHGLHANECSKSAVRKGYLDGLNEQIFGYWKNNLRHGCWQLMGPQPFRMSQVYMSLPLSKGMKDLFFSAWTLASLAPDSGPESLHVETIGNHSQAPWENRKSRCSDWKMSVQKWSRDPCHSAVTDKRVGLEVVELNCNKKLCEINIHLFKGPVDQGLPVVCHRTTQKNTWKAGCFSMFLCLALFSKAMIFRWHIKSVLDGHRLGRMAVSTSFETCWNHFHWIREWETWMSIHTIPYHSIPYHTIPFHTIAYHHIYKKKHIQ